jgi:hypothetical protein
MKYAIVNSGVVRNIIEWDGVSEYHTEGTLIEADANAYIGGVFASGAFVARPPSPEPEPTAEELQAQADKESANQKLRDLGLTDSEIEALKS